MNEIIQAILNRRSCRAFEEKSVPREAVEQILACALAAPSGMGKQSWKFTAVMDRSKIQRLAKVTARALDRDESYDMYSPSVLILTSNEKTSPYVKEDNACAMENIYLAANALSLGCVWINQLLTVFDEPEVRAVLDELHIPQDHGIYGCAAIGYPKEGAVPPQKKIKGKSEIID